MDDSPKLSAAQAEQGPEANLQADTHSSRPSEPQASEVPMTDQLDHEEDPGASSRSASTPNPQSNSRPNFDVWPEVLNSLESLFDPHNARYNRDRSPRQAYYRRTRQDAMLGLHDEAHRLWRYAQREFSRLKGVRGRQQQRELALSVLEIVRQMAEELDAAPLQSGVDLADLRRRLRIVESKATLHQRLAEMRLSLLS